MYIYLNIHFFVCFNIYLNMRRMHLKKKVKCKKIHNLSKKLLITFVISTILFGNIYIYNQKVSPLLMNYAENKIQELASIVITESLNDNLMESLKSEELFVVTKTDNQIETIDFNPVVINKIIIDSLMIIRKTLNNSNNLQKEKISIGSILNNPFLNNKGPKLTITYETTNDLSANLSNKITPYGINNAIIETFINVDLTFNIVIPLSTKKIKSNLFIPISIKIIEGKVPEYYMNGYNENSSILSIPVK